MGTYKTTYKTYQITGEDVVAPKGCANFPDTTYANHKNPEFVGESKPTNGNAYKTGSTYIPYTPQ